MIIKFEVFALFSIYNFINIIVKNIYRAENHNIFFKLIIFHLISNFPKKKKKKILTNTNRGEGNYGRKAGQIGTSVKFPISDVSDDRRSWTTRNPNVDKNILSFITSCQAMRCHASHIHAWMCEYIHT